MRYSCGNVALFDFYGASVATKFVFKLLNDVRSDGHRFAFIIIAIRLRPASHHFGDATCHCSLQPF